MPESSREEIAKLEALYANNPEGRVFTHLAEALRRAGDLERARTILEDGLAKHPTYASAHVVHGRVLAGLDRSDEAAEAFRRVLSLDPNNLIALRSLGDLARSAGRAEEAIGYFEQLKHHDPNNEEIDQIITELSARPAPAAEPAAPPPPAEAVAEQEWEPPAPAVVSNDIDLDWVPDLGNAFDALPGDLATLTSAPAAAQPGEPEPAVEEQPIFDLPDGVGDLALDAAMDQASESPTEEVDFGSTSFESDFELPTFDEPATEDEQPLESFSFESDAALEPAVTFEPAVPFEPEPESFEAAFEPFEAAFELPASEPETEQTGEVVTETIAELYTSQGLHDRAADVYRALLRQRPGDAALEARLREAESAAGGGWEDAFSEPVFEPTAPEALEPAATSAPESEPDAEGWIAGGAGTADSAPTPYAWSETAEPENSGAPVRDYFQGLLSWRPANSSTSRSATEAGYPSAPPPTDEEDPLLLLEELAPPDEEQEPTPPPPLTAATVVAPEPLPWEEPAPEPVQPPPPPPAAPPAANAGAEAKTSDEAFDAWFGTPEPEQPQAVAPEATASASQAEGEAGGEDDDDLEMFRSWLQSLKK